MTTGKIAQYLACGKAVITTALPGMIAVISGEHQGIVYTNSVEEMTGEIVSLLKSTELRQKLEQAGLNYVKQVHSYDKIAHQLETRIEQIIKDKQDNISAKIKTS